MEKEIQAMKVQFDKQATDFEVLRRDLQSRNADLLTELESFISKAQDIRRSIKTTLDTLEGDVRRLRKERDDIRSLYEQRNAELMRICTGETAPNEELVALMQQVLEKVTDTSSKVSSQLSQNFQVSDDSKIADIYKTIAHLKDNEKAILGELEILAQAFDDSENKVRSLQKQLSDSQVLISKLQNDKLKAEFSSNQAKKEAETALHKAQDLERLALSRLETAENQEIYWQRKSAKLNEQISSLMIEANKQSANLGSLVMENKNMRDRFEQISVLRLEDTIAELKCSLYQCQQSRNKIEEDLTSMQRKYSSQFGQDPEKAQIQEELVLYKKLMKCNSCHIRDKNSVITKCMHVFCRNCLDNRIETRQRKCPNCGEPFGANDVKQIYL